MQLYVSHSLLVDLDGLLKVLDHIRCGGRGMRHILRGVYDALRNVGRVYDRPLCACPACIKQAQAEDCQNFYSHFLSLDLVVIIGCHCLSSALSAAGVTLI